MLVNQIVSILRSHFFDIKDADIALKSELFLGSVTAVIESCMKEKRLCLVPYVAVDKLKEYGLVPVGRCISNL